jgi:L-2-hydroxycarboxylate dehydrogenase (NAD+)
MSYKNYDCKKVESLCKRIFQGYGFSEEDSNIITDVLIASDMFGIESHGVQRLILYYNGIKCGRIEVSNKPIIVKETPVSVVVDGNKAMGQLVAKMAMEKAIEKAKTTGIGMAVVRNSNHYGIAGYYSRMAEKEGLLGISMTNTQAVVTPTFGKQQFIGTNPISIAMPAKPIPFILDMSTSVVTRGKIEVYGKNNKPLPAGWAVDADGKSAADANEIVYLTNNSDKGGILPLGGEGELFSGYKGYGLGVAVELFTSILSGGLTSDILAYRGHMSLFYIADYSSYARFREMKLFHEIYN